MGPTARKGLPSSWDAGASGIPSRLLAEFFIDKLSLMSLAINFVINGGYGDASEVCLEPPLSLVPALTSQDDRLVWGRARRHRQLVQQGGCGGKW